MAFRNRIVRISQLVFDTLATGLTGARVVIQTVGGLSNRLQMFTGIPHEYSPAMLYVSGTETSSTNYHTNTFLFGAHPQVQERVPASGYQSAQAGVFFDDYYDPPVVVGSSAMLAADIVSLQCTTAQAALRGTDQRLGIEFNGTPQCFTGNEGAISGAAPPKGMPKLVKQGTAVVLTNGVGEAGVFFHDGAFPNGVVSFVAVNGDYGAYVGTFATRGNSRDHCDIKTIPNLANANVRVNYIAYGW